MTRRARHLTVTAALAGALLAAGCGNDSAQTGTNPSTSSSAPAKSQQASGHGGCLTTLAKPPASASTFAAGDTSARRTFLSGAAALIQDESEEQPMLLTAAGTTPAPGRGWAATSAGFLVSTSNDMISADSLAMVRGDGSVVWAGLDGTGLELDNLLALPEVVIATTYVELPDSSAGKRAAVSLTDGTPADLPAEVPAEGPLWDTNATSPLQAAPTTLIPADVDGKSYLDTATGKTISTPIGFVAAAAGDRLIVAEGSSLILHGPDGSEPLPAPAQGGASGVAVCGDLVYTYANDALKVATLDAPEKAIATALVPSPGRVQDASVYANPGGVVVELEVDGDLGADGIASSTSTRYLFTG